MLVRIKSWSAAIALLVASAQGAPARLSTADEASTWVLRFVNAISDPALRTENADAAITDLRRFIPLRNDDHRPGCYSLLSLGEHPAPFVVGASLSLVTASEDKPCGNERIGLLHVTLKTPRPGSDVEIASRRLTELFGKPLSTGPVGHNFYKHWQISKLAAITIDVSDLPSEEGEFAISLASAPAGRHMPLLGF